MKKTRVIGVDISEVNKAIKKLEDEGWEVVDTTVLQTESEILRDTRYVIAYITAQKEEDKSIYEKMYLLEKYCANYKYKHRCLCKDCRIENICDKYEGCAIPHWDFNDVEKAYEEVAEDGDR